MRVQLVAMARPGTSKEVDLAAAQDHFETTYSTQTLKIDIEVRRRKRGVRHVANDILFVVSFSSSESGNLPLLNVLIGVHQSILTLIRKLKRYFKEDGKRRLVFFSVIHNP